MPREPKPRIDYLDSLKGFAIILVVLGHICAGYNAAQMYFSAKDVLDSIHKAVYMFHMPLFMTISGYVFRMAYFSDEGEPQRSRIFWQALNLVLTCILFSAMLGLAKMVAIRYTNSVTTLRDILLIPVRPISPYWYLYALATSYIVFSLRGALLCRLWPVVLLPALALVSFWSDAVTDAWFEIGKSLYYFFFFALGINLRRTEKSFSLNYIYTLIFGVVATVLVVRFWHDGRHIDTIPVVNLVVGASFTLFFWGAFSNIRFLAKNQALCLVGRYSLEIYVLHCVFTAGHRAVLPQLGVENAFTGTVLNLINSVLISILLAAACKRFGVHTLIFKPVSYFRRKVMLY